MPSITSKRITNFNLTENSLLKHIQKQPLTLLSLTLIFSLLLMLNLTSAKLIGVIQVNRHGARTGDGFEDLSSKLFFGTKSKQLTISGISQHELLGHYIADNYMHNPDKDLNILASEFSENEFKVFSSSLQRAIFSGFGFIKGIYPVSKFKLNFIGKKNFTLNKNYSNLISSDLLTNVTLPISGYAPRRQVPEIPLNIVDGETDSIFKIKNCKIKIGDFLFSNLTVKELIGLDNVRLNYSEPIVLSKDEIESAVEEIKDKFPIAFLKRMLPKNKNNKNFFEKANKNENENDKINELLKTEAELLAEKNENEINFNNNKFDSGENKKIKKNKKIKCPQEEFFNEKVQKELLTVPDKSKFLKKVNSFLRFAQFHFGNNFLVLSENTQITLNKIQVNKSYHYLLSKSNNQKLLNSRIFDEFKFYLVDFLKNYLQNKPKRLKYVVYSGHDSNILGILANFFDRKFLLEKMQNLKAHYYFVQPDLASHFILELHTLKKTEGFLGLNTFDTFIRLVYNGKNLSEGLNKDFFVYNERLEGFELKNFLRFLDTQIDLEYKNLNCETDSDEDDL